MPFLSISEAPTELQTLFHTEKESILAHCYEPEPGLFVAESAKVTLRAFEAGYEPVAMLIEDAQINQEANDLFSVLSDVPVYHADSRTFKEVSGYPMTRGVLALFRRKERTEANKLLTSDLRRIAVLEEVGNPANVGAIFRNAAALGIDAILLTRGCCDPLSRRCLRVSMGTVFMVPWVMTGQSGAALIPQLKEHGIQTAAMALTDRCISITDQSLKELPQLAIFLGNEGNGLPQETISACDHVVRIPMREGVDSLNVAAASAVAFWELR